MGWPPVYQVAWALLVYNLGCVARWVLAAVRAPWTDR